MPGPAVRFAAIGLALVAATALAGCVGGTPKPMPVPTGSGSASPSATPAPKPTKVPEFKPDGTAAANKQFFDYVNSEYQSVYKMGTGADIVTNLVNHGFVKTDMEVTFDTTAIDIPADSIVVSVRMQGECLVGQLSPTGYTSFLAPLLGTGKCLIGTTRPIDW